MFSVLKSSLNEVRWKNSPYSKQLVWCWAWKTPAFTFLQDSMSLQRNSWECSWEHHSTGKNLLIVLWKPFLYTGRECRVHLERNVCSRSITLSVRSHRSRALREASRSQFLRYQIPALVSLYISSKIIRKQAGNPLPKCTLSICVLFRHAYRRSSNPSEPKLLQHPRGKAAHRHSHLRQET